MTNPIRWGILGTGNIAHSFATGLRYIPDATLMAVGSRSQATAHTFADAFDIPHRHPSYEQLARDPEVDVVYIATPHIFHKDNSLLCLQQGKAVLCEKAFTINAAEAEALIQYARTHRLFLMEAMWTRFLPALVKLRGLLADNVIGDVRMMTANLSSRSAIDPTNRFFAPGLGGGALLDLGIYPLSLASLVFGASQRVLSMAHLGETGVDEQAVIILSFDQGRLASVFTANRTNSPGGAVITGTTGHISIHGPLYCPPRLTLSIHGQQDTVIDTPYEGNGYNYEAVEVMRCLRTGALESEIMPLDETLAIMQTVDHIRAQWGLRYPTE